MKEATVELVALPLSANIPIIFPQHVTKTWKSREMNTPDCWEQLRIVLSLYFWSEQTAGRIQWSLFFQIYTLLSKKPIHHWLNPATSKDIKLHTYTSQLSYPSSFFWGWQWNNLKLFFPRLCLHNSSPVHVHMKETNANRRPRHTFLFTAGYLN